MADGWVEAVIEKNHKCPDGKGCHDARTAGGHQGICADSYCLRVCNGDGPLPGAFPSDEWPAEITAANKTKDGP